MKDGFVKVAAITPRVRVADVKTNVDEVIDLMHEAASAGAKIIVFPKLCITGASCGDLLHQMALLNAAKEGIDRIVRNSVSDDALVFVNFPCDTKTGVMPVTAVIKSGKLLRLVHEAEEVIFTVTVQGSGRQFTVGCGAAPNAAIAVRPLAEYEMVTADTVRTQEALVDSRRGCCALVEANAGEGESTTDHVYAGHNLIVQCGKMLAESGSFTNGILYGVVDVDLIAAQRRRNAARTDAAAGGMLYGEEIVFKCAETPLGGTVSKYPFFAEDPAEMKRRISQILMLQVMGLKKRLTHCNCDTAVIGISGGLDSTLALLVAVKTFDLLNKSRKNILAVTMPCFGTSDRTYQNALKMMDLLGVTKREISIREAVTGHFEDIGHDINVRNATFENAQARERTQVLMDLANDTNGLVVGTGDLSELALGWTTYNGDHMSNYAVNANVPKTLMRRIVGFLAEEAEQNEAQELAETLRDVIATPVSPELLPTTEGNIAQKTEDLIGPYELHDFYLYYVLRYGFEPHKIYRMAVAAFDGVYDGATVKRWLANFYRRFFSQQFKRSCLCDAPKIGSVGISPRGDLKMPSDAVAATWLADLERV